jgi:hypothetical protein
MDIKIIENGNGGDLVFENGDIQTTSEVYQQPYLAHFGGNTEATSQDYAEGKEREDYFMNPFMQEKEQFNSTFEKTMNETPLSSSGRIKLEQAAETDLSYLSDFANTTSDVEITGVDKIQLIDKINNQNKTNFSYIWDEAKDEIIE